MRPLNLPAPVNCLRADEGSASHFNYLCDNTLLTWMHIRLLLECLLRLPVLVWCRLSRPTDVRSCRR